jgi:hypothetical protein
VLPRLYRGWVLRWAGEAFGTRLSGVREPLGCALGATGPKELIRCYNQVDTWRQ